MNNVVDTSASSDSGSSPTSSEQVPSSVESPVPNLESPDPIPDHLDLTESTGHASELEDQGEVDGIPCQDDSDSVEMGDLEMTDSEMDDTPDEPKAEQSLDSTMQSLRKKVMEDYPQLSFDKLCIAHCKVSLEAQGYPAIRSSKRSWKLIYPALSFMMNGQLFAEYAHVTNMLGLYIYFNWNNLL